MLALLKAAAKAVMRVVKSVVLMDEMSVELSVGQLVV
jgi:hypothetical protein